MGKKTQHRLFDDDLPERLPVDLPYLNPKYRLKAAIRQMLAESGYSRAQIVDRMNQAAPVEGLGKRVTLTQLDTWAAASKPQLPAAEQLPALCWAAESLLPLHRPPARCHRGLEDCIGGWGIGVGEDHGS